jgi:hypothetical protein
LIERDPAFIQGVATQDPATVEALLRAFARSWAGTTPDEFEVQVRVWLSTAKQPKLGVSYIERVYQPMLELFDVLKDNGFRVFAAPVAGATSCGCSPRRPGASTKRTSSAPPPSTPTQTARWDAGSR